MIVDESIRAIRKYVAELNAQPATVARDAGLHPNTLRDLWAPEWNPTLRTLRKLEKLIERGAKGGGN